MYAISEDQVTKYLQKRITETFKLKPDLNISWQNEPVPDVNAIRKEAPLSKLQQEQAKKQELALQIQQQQRQRPTQIGANKKLQNTPMQHVVNGVVCISSISGSSNVLTGSGGYEEESCKEATPKKRKNRRSNSRSQSRSVSSSSSSSAGNRSINSNRSGGIYNNNNAHGSFIKKKRLGASE